MFLIWQLFETAAHWIDDVTETREAYDANGIDLDVGEGIRCCAYLIYIAVWETKTTAIRAMIF